MTESRLLLTADRNLRRLYANDIPGLEAFANQLAQDASTNPVTITGAGSEGGQGSGQITMAREIWLAAAEELLADPTFLAGHGAQRPPRVILPDYRFSQPV